MAIIKPVILEDGRLKTAGADDQVPQSFVEGLEPSLESKASKSELTSGLGLKVDKEEGKGLSTEDYTTSEKDKLAGIQAGAQVNAVTSVSGKTGEVTLDKDDVGLGNVDNTPDIDKPISNPAQAALDNKVDKVAGKGLSDTNYTQAEKDKLAGVASEATKNRDDSENADKEHTHTVDQVTGLIAALDNKVDKVEGKVLSDTNFTQAEKDKLASLEGSKFVGLFVSESELPTTGSEGEYANVDGGVGSDVYRVIWDSSDNKWVRMQGVSTELTASQIKQLYESNPDTNAFTDDEKTKLAGIAVGATKNRADVENADKVHTHPWTQVTGQPATATRWPTFDEVTGKPVNYPTNWVSVDDKPVTATRWPTFDEVTGKPTNYPTTWASVESKPATATRWPTWSEVSDKPSLGTAATRDVGTAAGNVMEVGEFGVGASSVTATYPSVPATGTQIVHYFNSGVPGPLGRGYSDRTSYLEMNCSNHRTTIVSDGSSLYFSWVYNKAPEANDFKELYHTGNMPSSHITVASLVSSGNVTAYSDIKLKEDIKVIPDAITKVNALHGYTYKRKDIKDATRHTGVIAQEVQKVLPEAVMENEDGTLSVAYGNMVGLLIEAIKELKTEVDELKEKLREDS